ncbi:MAG: SAM-dependent methyltransferase [Saprospiraceae bacterium]
MADSSGVLYLIPCPIAEDGLSTLPSATIDVARKLEFFIVERAKSARQFLKKIGHPLPMAQIHMHEIASVQIENIDFLFHLTLGKSMGVLSEAGNPCIADPGNIAVQYAHSKGIKVVPLVGPSSILLALIASGFNGQNFSFSGYLSNKKPELKIQLKKLESIVEQTSQTQIFMETPYRVPFILEGLLTTLKPNTRLCIAGDVTGEGEIIQQKTIAKWKIDGFERFIKKPCIFILGKETF